MGSVVLFYVFWEPSRDWNRDLQRLDLGGSAILDRNGLRASDFSVKVHGYRFVKEYNMIVNGYSMYAVCIVHTAQSNISCFIRAFLCVATPPPSVFGFPRNEISGDH